jgi:dTDP-4-amino-4,6-dideoxygalactose transaminase
MHDEIGFNYRMPNLNAALGYAQLARLNAYVRSKRRLAGEYADFLAGGELAFCVEPDGTRSNYWLCAVVCPAPEVRNVLLRETNASGISTRPVWIPMHRLPMYADALRGPLAMTEYLADRLVNLPSSVPPSANGRMTER